MPVPEPIEDFESLENLDELDLMIASALQSEPMRPAPFTLHRRVQERIRIIALKERQRVRFRYTMLSLAVAFSSATLMAAALVVFTNFELVRTNGLPGGLGIYDLYASSMTLSASSYGGAYSLMTAVLLAAVTILIGLAPLRAHRRRSRG